MSLAFVPSKDSLKCFLYIRCLRCGVSHSLKRLLRLDKKKVTLCVCGSVR